MTTLPCPYLNTEVELTDEREQHIRDKHPELLPAYRTQLIQTVADPDEIRRDSRFPNSLLFSHWFPGVKGVNLSLLWLSLIQLPLNGIGL
ncbi:MAG TPA: hypothetical protein VFX56_06795 [Nitrospira sp.]|nr:hypothetical protein [Nitrospira sp.]